MRCSLHRNILSQIWQQFPWNWRFHITNFQGNVFAALLRETHLHWMNLGNPYTTHMQLPPFAVQGWGHPAHSSLRKSAAGKTEIPGWFSLQVQVWLLFTLSCRHRALLCTSAKSWQWYGESRGCHSQLPFHLSIDFCSSLHCGSSADKVSLP